MQSVSSTPIPVQTMALPNAKIDATLSPKEFWYSVIRANSLRYVGPGLPDAFCRQPDGTVATNKPFIAKGLDSLAQFLRKLNCPDLPNLVFTMGQQRFSLKRAGQGGIGTTYQLTPQSEQGEKKPFAFKVFARSIMYDVFNESRDGPVGEMMNGLLFNNRASDVPQFYLGNPHSKQQWMLSEWIDPTTPLKPGVPIATLVRDLKLNVHDDHSGNRFKNGYRVDLGSISPLSTVGFWLYVAKFHITRVVVGAVSWLGNAFNWLFRPEIRKTVTSCQTLATQLTTAPKDQAGELRSKLEQGLNKLAKRYQPALSDIQVQA